MRCQPLSLLVVVGRLRVQALRLLQPSLQNHPPHSLLLGLLGLPELLPALGDAVCLPQLLQPCLGRQLAAQRG